MVGLILNTYFCMPGKYLNLTLFLEILYRTIYFNKILYHFPLKNTTLKIVYFY